MTRFPEEQLDSSVGYFDARPGQTLQNKRWSILRKLGWGPRSSTWLAVDSKDADNITAIKIFTVAATVDSYASKELDMLRGPLNQPTLPFPSIQGHFNEQSPKGTHLCLVMVVLGPSVESFRYSSDGGHLPLHLVKKIVADILEALCELQKQKIVHGAVNPDNFLFVSAQAAQDIRAVISAFPTNQVEVIGSDVDGVVYHLVRSQPIEHGFKWSDSQATFAEASICLSNFAYARFTQGPSSPALGTIPAPEALQGANVDQKSDIWALGIAAYLLLTGTPLFPPSSPNDNHKETTVANLEQLLVSSNKLPEIDIPSTLVFLKACLEIHPSDRANADDLVGSDWVQQGQACSCGWSWCAKE